MVSTFFLLDNYVEAISSMKTQMLASNQNISATVPARNLFAINVANAASTGSGILNPTCVDNFTSWPNSTTFKANVPWSTAMVGEYVQNSTYTNNFEHDINGDGLPDFMYVFHQSGATYTTMTDCVYLSNGAGWTKAYQCVATTTPRFYGDCAQL